MVPILSPITVPTLHITATDDNVRIPGYNSSVADRVAVFEATGSPTKVLADWPQRYPEITGTFIDRAPASI